MIFDLFTDSIKESFDQIEQNESQVIFAWQCSHMRWLNKIVFIFVLFL